MTEQERNVLLNELRQQESQREKQIKRERFRRLNPYAKKGAVVFAGSSLMEQFPLYEFLQDDDLHCTLYNRGIGGFTTTELLEAMDECILELQPAHLFLNIGTNDLNARTTTAPPCWAGMRRSCSRSGKNCPKQSSTCWPIIR